MVGLWFTVQPLASTEWCNRHCGTDFAATAARYGNGRCLAPFSLVLDGFSLLPYNLHRKICFRLP
jgi:uncharacterized protein YceK